MRIRFNSLVGPILRLAKTYASSTRFPHSAKQLARARRVITVGSEKLNKIADFTGLYHGITFEAIQLNRCIATKTVVNGALAAPKWTKYRSITKDQVSHTTNQGHAMAPGAEPPTILFIHGGAFFMNNPNVYKIVTSGLARLTGGPVFAPDYRKAPETPFPGNVNDCVEAYRHLIENLKIDSTRIVLVGDSAGGNLAVATFVKSVHHLGLPAPAAIALMSPWLDLASAGESYKVLKRVDPILPCESIRRAAWLYLKGSYSYDSFGDDAQRRLQQMCEEKGMPFVYGDQRKNYEAKLRDPRVSPVYLTDSKILSSFPATLIHCGTSEVLLSDAVAFARRVNREISESNGEGHSQVPNGSDATDWGNLPSIGESAWLTANGRVKVKVFGRQFHVFQLTWPIDEAGQTSMQEIAQFAWNQTR